MSDNLSSKPLAWILGEGRITPADPASPYKRPDDRNWQPLYRLSPQPCVACAEFVRMQHDIASLLDVDADTDSIDLHERIYGELSKRAAVPPEASRLSDHQCDEIIAALETYEWSGLTRDDIRFLAGTIHAHRDAETKESSRSCGCMGGVCVKQQQAWKLPPGVHCFKDKPDETSEPCPLCDGVGGGVTRDGIEIECSRCKGTGKN